jgi:hypothetical protein
MTPRTRYQESDGLLTIRNAWMEGRAPIGPLSVFETNINVLLALFLGRGTSVLLGAEEGDAQPVTIINKHSGKALEIEGASTNQFAWTRQLTRNGEPNQRWFIERPKFSTPIWATTFSLKASLTPAVRACTLACTLRGRRSHRSWKASEGR